MSNFENRVHPELRKIFSVLPDIVLTEDKIGQLRESDALYQAQSTDRVSVTERLIPGGGEAPDIPVVVFTPAEKKKTPGPGILFIHGGGYVCGSARDFGCLQIAEETGCPVYSVDYRLAPENPYPAGLEDCYTALKWMHENAGELGLDRSRIAVVGGSAGGGLAAALTLLARDRKDPPICFQMLIYPMLDDRCDTPSSIEMTDSRIWNRTSTLNCWRLYLSSIKDGEVPQYAAPARVTDPSGLPPLYALVGELEPFRDEVIEYASKLVRAGVPTELHLYPGCFHACERIAPNAKISRQIINGYISALNLALWGIDS